MAPFSKSTLCVEPGAHNRAPGGTLYVRYTDVINDKIDKCLLVYSVLS